MSRPVTNSSRRVGQPKHGLAAKPAPQAHKVRLVFDDDIPAYLKFLEEFEKRSARVRLKVR